MFYAICPGTDLAYSAAPGAAWGALSGL